MDAVSGPCLPGTARDAVASEVPPARLHRALSEALSSASTRLPRHTWTMRTFPGSCAFRETSLASLCYWRAPRSLEWHDGAGEFPVDTCAMNASLYTLFASPCPIYLMAHFAVGKIWSFFRRLPPTPPVRRYGTLKNMIPRFPCA